MGTHILLDVGHGVICSVPRRWTDLEAPDPEVAMGKGQAVVRLQDLESLLCVVQELTDKQTDEVSP
jgi:hypothetical protein